MTFSLAYEYVASPPFLNMRLLLVLVLPVLGVTSPASSTSSTSASDFKEDSISHEEFMLSIYKINDELWLLFLPF